MVAGGFVLEDPGTNLTAFDVSRMLSGQPAATTPGVTSTLDYPGAGQGPLAKTAATNAPASPEREFILQIQAMLAAAEHPFPSGPQNLTAGRLAEAAPLPGTLSEAIGAGLATHGIPDVATPPTNAPRTTGKRSRSDGDRRRLAKEIGEAVGKRLDRAVTKLLTGIRKQRTSKSQPDQQVKTLADVAKKGWAALSEMGRAAIENAHRDDSWLAGLRKITEQRDQDRENKKTEAKERDRYQEQKKTRTSTRLLEKSQQQLQSLFQPLGNAIENFRNVGRTKANEAVVNLAKKLGLDKLGKQFERESRGFAANAARGGLGSAAARAFGQGAVGRVGFNLAGRAAGVAAAGDAGAAGAGAAAGEGGLMAGAGAALATPAGLIAAVGLAAAGTGAALVGLTRRVQHTGEALLENQRDLAKYNAGIAVTFAEFERGRFLRDVQRANQTSASTNLLGQSNTLLQNTTQPFVVTATNLRNIVASGVTAALAAWLQLSGLKAAADGMAKLSDQLARAMGGQAGPPGNPALRFLDDVAKGKFKSPPPPKNKAPKRPGQP